MAIKKIERKLGFWEKTYLPEVVKGLRLTARHFFRNLFIHFLPIQHSVHSNLNSS